ncbi:ribbon-helix-helix protein, CopG family [Qipengyuania aquimaris]|uniref:Ribbon-helix-helix protein, CopG family n=1 Tax=Qipengyuania aquimaris TaxID=255984 RepID=A0A9Q3S214_9SPHN|nr:ribbon-helix-helix protein, CopG family [Qipengyuania aquimaris]
MISEQGVSRVTASLTRSQEIALKQLAAHHKVSVSWLIRYAVDQLIDSAEGTQLPLDFGRRN